LKWIVSDFFVVTRVIPFFLPFDCRRIPKIKLRTPGTPAPASFPANPWYNVTIPAVPLELFAFLSDE
jgi:hypothetical protein